MTPAELGVSQGKKGPRKDLGSHFRRGLTRLVLRRRNVLCFNASLLSWEAEDCQRGYD